jgi:hypothetical protein
MNGLSNRNGRPTAVTVAVALLGAECLLRLWMQWLAADWRAVPTYTSFVFKGPFSLLLIWAVYGGRNWGRWVLALLCIPTLVYGTRDIVVRHYAVIDLVVITHVLLLKATAVVLLFVPSSNAWFGAGGKPANPRGRANGRQPFSSETNRTPEAAASRRSP